MKAIPVGKSFAIVDDEDFAHLSGFTWWLTTDQLHAYTTVDKKTVYMHRVIMEAEEGQIIHHRDGIGLNNIRSNLQVLTKEEHDSIPFKRIQSNNTSGKSGVWYAKDRSNWVAKIKVEGKQIHLGVFKSFGAAVAARLAAEIRFFGSPKDLPIQTTEWGPR